MTDDIKLFDFVNAASHSKKDLIKNSDQPTQTEKLYSAYVINRAFSMYDDTILHANEMNLRPHLFADAQFKYYLGVLRPRKRFSKWHKLKSDDDLDLVQKVYEVNRTVAKMYLKLLRKEDLKLMQEKMNTGG